MHHKLQSIIDQFLSFTPASNQRMTGSKLQNHLSYAQNIASCRD